MKEKIEQKESNKKKIIVVITIICIISAFLLVGISYALWQTTKVQEDFNIISGGCFDVSLEGENPINLANTYPITDQDGQATTPYVFTIKNKCSSQANYDIALESLVDSTLDSSKIKVMINENIKILNNFTETEKYFDNSKDSRLLETGILDAEETVTYNLRLWIDENVTNEDQNKKFDGKIVVKSAVLEEKKIADNVEVGDYISMTPTSTSYTAPSELTGCLNDSNCTQNTINPSELNLWRVIKKNDDGSIDVVSEYVSSTKVYFRGVIGYLKSVGTLNTLANQYTNEKYVLKARHMGYNEQTEYCISLEDCTEDVGYETDSNLVLSVTGTLVGETPLKTTSSYWLSSRIVRFDASSTGYRIRYISDTGELGDDWAYGAFSDGGESDRSIQTSVRPILTLKSDIELASGDGKSAETPYTFK